MDKIVRMDNKGRISIPKAVREALNIKEGQYLRVKVAGNKIILEPIGSYASKYYGMFKVKKWPKDLDEFVREAMERLWMVGM